MRAFYLSLLIFIPLISNGQFTYVLDNSIPIEDENGAKLTTPWVGGLNAAQYNTMDLDNDGKEDLILFDRMADKVLTFLNRNNTYQYIPEYENYFPVNISDWFILRY
jgi:hypothetical protein